MSKPQRASAPPTPDAAAVWAPLKTVKPWVDNPRKNEGRPVEAVADSIRRFGWGRPLVTRRGVLVIGHTARLAALELVKRWSNTTAEQRATWHPEAVRTAERGEAPVRARDDLPEGEAHLLALADNRLGEFAEWDERKVLEILQRYDAAAANSVGWNDKELRKLTQSIARANRVVEDEVPAPPATPIVQPGELWILGRHRLLCGDSRDPACVSRVMADARATCVFTDPPYGVSIGAKNRLLNSIQRGGRNLSDIEDDDAAPDDLKERLLPAFVNMRAIVMSDDCALLVCSPQGSELFATMLAMMLEAGFPARHVLIWKKNQPTFSMGRLDYDYQHEPIILTWGKRHKRPMLGTHRTSVWDVDKPRASVEHPTMKPVELYANAYLNHSDADDTVADLYAGSGTAFIAAEQVGRAACGIELAPKFCDVIIERWQNLSGGKAQRAV